MTQNYVNGFFTKCAELKVPYDAAVAMYKVAARDWEGMPGYPGGPEYTPAKPVVQTNTVEPGILDKVRSVGKKVFDRMRRRNRPRTGVPARPWHIGITPPLKDVPPNYNRKSPINLPGGINELPGISEKYRKNIEELMKSKPSPEDINKYNSGTTNAPPQTSPDVAPKTGLEEFKRYFPKPGLNERVRSKDEMQRLYEGFMKKRTPPL